jgi:hypothetical protein
METIGSLLSSQKPAIDQYLDPDACSTEFSPYFPEFILILFTIYALVFRAASLRQVFRLTMTMKSHERGS